MVDRAHTWKAAKMKFLFIKFNQFIKGHSSREAAAQLHMNHSLQTVRKPTDKKKKKLSELQGTSKIKAFQ